MGTVLTSGPSDYRAEGSNQFNMAKSKLRQLVKVSLGCGQLSVGGEVTNRVTIKEPRGVQERINQLLDRNPFARFVTQQTTAAVERTRESEGGERRPRPRFVSAAQLCFENPSPRDAGAARGWCTHASCSDTTHRTALSLPTQGAPFGSPCLCRRAGPP
jgi:hypothetical protein